MAGGTTKNLDHRNSLRICCEQSQRSRGTSPFFLAIRFFPEHLPETQGKRIRLLEKTGCKDGLNLKKRTQKSRAPAFGQRTRVEKPNGPRGNKNSPPQPKRGREPSEPRLAPRWRRSPGMAARSARGEWARGAGGGQGLFWVPCRTRIFGDPAGLPFLVLQIFMRLEVGTNFFLVKFVRVTADGLNKFFAPRAR